MCTRRRFQSGRLPKEINMRPSMKNGIGFTIAAVLLGLSGIGSAQSQSAQLPDPLTAGWKGQTICEKLHEDASVRIVRCVLPPNVGHEKHFHPPTYTYVLAGGKVRVTSAAGSQEVELKTGAGRFSPPIEWHELLNIGEQPMAFLLVEPKAK
jgi:quercetin dioxygenase-like cupin family protein